MRNFSFLLGLVLAIVLIAGCQNMRGRDVGTLTGAGIGAAAGGLATGSAGGAAVGAVAGGVGGYFVGKNMEKKK